MPHLRSVSQSPKLMRWNQLLSMRICGLQRPLREGGVELLLVHVAKTIGRGDNDTWKSTIGEFTRDLNWDHIREDVKPFLISNADYDLLDLDILLSLLRR